MKYKSLKSKIILAIVIFFIINFADVKFRKFGRVLLDLNDSEYYY